jgi:hypothetical protein
VAKLGQPNAESKGTKGITLLTQAAKIFSAEAVTFLKTS